MTLLFYIAAVVAILATVMVITRFNAVHALLYLIVSLLAVAMVFYTLGAPFVAALEIIIYAGAIMVLFIFVIMMLNLGDESRVQEISWFSPGAWIGPSLLSLILLGEFIYILVNNPLHPLAGKAVPPKAVGISLFGKYLLGVELAAIMLLAGIVGAYHLGHRKKQVKHRFLQEGASE